jgi:uncharacterized protein (TIGR03435 family)
MINHLWQSTLFAVVAWLLTLALKKNRASIRYWIWFAASVKFLIPLSLLVSAGSYLHLSRTPEFVQSNFRGIESFSRPLVAPASLPIDTPAPARFAPVRPWVVVWFLMAPWFAGFTAVALSQYLRRLRFRALLENAQFLNQGREVEALRRVHSRRGCRAPIHLALSPSALEPGVCGIFTHLLLLPADISTRLDGAQLEAVLAHEVAHIERSDNLFAAVHMFVEAMFWFHPLVWWIGSRMIEERERACDGDVLQSGSDAEAYAGAILKVCQYYMASPLSTVSGISGSNLRKRIEDIMAKRTGDQLNLAKKVLVVTAVAILVAVPILAGVMHGVETTTQTPGSTVAFEVASVKVNKSTDTSEIALQYLPSGRFIARGAPLFILIQQAYDGERIAPSAEFQKLDGNIIQRRYDIEAIAAEGAIPSGASSETRNEKLRQMLQTLLADRFKLTVHREAKQQPVYALVVTKSGPKMQKSTLQEKECGTRVSDLFDASSCHSFMGGQGQGLHGLAVNMSDLAGFLIRFADKPVINKTGLTGLYDIQTVGWRPLVPRPPRPDGGTESQRAEDLAFADPNRPTLNDVLDGLGLKLETQTASVNTLFLDYLEAPSEN